MAGAKQALGLVWWGFKLKTGEIKKHYGDLRDCGETYEVWNGLACNGSVRKNQILDRWAQDQETTEREMR